ncbi:unnamed protein product [Euphydryas editha]|uniref:Uncharacterized protein n=1 Tax=Euphydryas editha TaxID=104508 RepID=A0AAU9USD4_EUPED|nr:unnamed protein product [Euphydryas editha]
MRRPQTAYFRLQLENARLRSDMKELKLQVEELLYERRERAPAVPSPKDKEDLVEEYSAFSRFNWRVPDLKATGSLQRQAGLGEKETGIHITLRLITENQPNDVRKSYSSYMNKYNKIPQSQECKSDINMHSDKTSSSFNEEVHCEIQKNKNYTHDEIPVRDGSSFNNHCYIESNDSGRGDAKASNKNISFDEIEMKMLKKMSQELQTDDNSISSLDSNIKLFKTTVNQILENFYSNMQDFEVYKKKFNEILEKNKGDSVVEMEDFIKEMIQHIGSSESSVSGSKLTAAKDLDQNSIICKTNVNLNEQRISNSLNSTIEAFKNENYLTDSTFGQNSSKFNTGDKKEQFLNIFLMSGTRYVEIKMNDRSLFSEINIRDQCFEGLKEPLASAENIKRLEAKKLELENYAKERESPIKDREIPVRNSNAKKNIHVDENFLDNDKDDCHKFFIFRICNYICRKIRKNAFG